MGTSTHRTRTSLVAVSVASLGLVLTVVGGTTPASAEEGIEDEGVEVISCDEEQVDSPGCEVGLIPPVVIDRDRPPVADDEDDQGEGVAAASCEADEVASPDCEVGLVPPVVVERDPQVDQPAADAPAPTTSVPEPARRPTEVAGIQVFPGAAPAAAPELPRTGSSTTTVALAGLGLVLLGAGSMVAARRPVEAPVR